MHIYIRDEQDSLLCHFMPNKVNAAVMKEALKINVKLKIAIFQFAMLK
jgi:hypothetical protein